MYSGSKLIDIQTVMSIILHHIPVGSNDNNNNSLFSQELHMTFISLTQ